MSAGGPESQQDSQGIYNIPLHSCFSFHYYNYFFCEFQKILFATDNLSTMVEEDNWFELEWRGVEESDKSFTRL